MAETVASGATAPRRGLSARGFATAFGAPLALAYFAMIGGTQWGEFSGTLRIANALVASAFVVLFIAGVTRRSDRIDRLVLLALLAFLAACLLSAFPRQALDAALAAICWVAVFYVSRDVLRDGRRRATVAATMIVLSVVTTLFLAAAEFGVAARWVSLTGGTTLPPLGMPVDVRPWGHEYDMAMLAVMLYPSWFIGSMGRLRIASAAVLGVVLGLSVILLGARNLWLAIALASALVALPPLVRYVSRATSRRRVVVIGAMAIAALLLLALSGPIIDRLLTGATIGQRTAMWSAATEAWLQRPIAGYGPGAFPWTLEATDFFSVNSGHHRHPHNVLFQLLPEAGIIGLVAAGLLLVSIGLPLVRHRRSLELWPIGVFLFGGIASNPTVYAYLIVVAIVWAAFALPRERVAVALVDSRGQATRRRLSFVGAAVIGLLTVPLLIGGVAYDGAVVAASRGDIAKAQDSLGLAASLDPGMAIYHRQLGVAYHLTGDNQAAVAEWRRATHLNPMDGVAWRALAIGLAAEGDAAAAHRALDEALVRDRSDPDNLLLLATWQSEAGDRAGLKQSVAEIALAWPTVMFAPGWHELLGDIVTSEEVISLALARWHAGSSSPEPLVGQPLLLSALADEQELSEASRLAGLSDTLVQATVAVAQCDAHAADVLDAANADDRRTDVYWALRLQLSSERGHIDAKALDTYDLRTGMRPSVERSRQYLNPLRQNNTSGALDPFGYGRLPMAWPEGMVRLPDPNAGLSRWLLDVRGRREALGASCG